MESASQRGWLWLGLAAGLGVLGDLLLRNTPPGISLVLWLGALLLLLWWTGRQERAAGPGGWLLAPALGLALALAWRDSPVLAGLDLLGVYTLLALAAWYARGGDLRSAGVADYLLGALAVTGRGLEAVPALLTREVPWREAPWGGWSERARAVGKGLLLGLPPLVLFGGLFMAADPVFARLLTGWMGLNLDPSHLLITVMCGAAAAGALGAWRRARPDLPPVQTQSAQPWLGMTEMITALGLVDALFAAFVAVQFRYLFGGADLVLASTGLTYADYARRGFFELVTVAALVLPMLLAVHWVLPADDARRQRWFRALAGGLLTLLTVVMASAVYRMWLYQQEFGLTELRLYTTAFMGWLALLVLCFALTVLRGRRERFAFGALVTGLAALLALHAINPDGLIARVNLARGASGRSVDYGYLTSLSADAAPAVVAGAASLPEPDRQQTLATAAQRWGARAGDWRSWNWSRAQAVSLLHTYR